MTRTNLELDEQACAAVMRRYELPTKRAAVNFALWQLAAELPIEEARRLKGSGWDGGLDVLRAARHSVLAIHQP
ncbi:MAG: type II toxin-antitoxin system VapB family antitoxin [Chloroflexi bacterium]|nr:type II toxin-antitoxin system VapB family antitoxin [Chloroflexota bacterium]